ncbi:hypothetical protein PCANC_09452 [Puccinia coronata f. sp. avenae]|uniref:Uncharacterized protein n=1 Tax=Puccinia coronata f. sp. avenae TaxID=200324 RepID=A0A2N5SUE7_9BASI|nr:hypothetical protein PCANC_09452 [Puccinia coronata f. sp. avenae]PLW23800.1 hypothetical protein PCASD_08734 [Puccinia coronata f. sp. avenae]
MQIYPSKSCFTSGCLPHQAKRYRSKDFWQVISSSSNYSQPGLWSLGGGIAVQTVAAALEINGHRAELYASRE